MCVFDAYTHVHGGVAHMCECKCEYFILSEKNIYAIG